MFAFDLRQAVTHTGKKTIIGCQHVAIEVELDHRRRTHQRADQVFMFAGGFDGAGQVAGENREVPDSSV
ncbi:hypothetical protein D3C87_1461180 [compost metagenome]